MTVGSFGAIVHGALYILSNVVLGLQMDAFLEYDKGNRYLWMFTDVWERYGVTIHDLWENKSMIEYVVVLGVLFVNDLRIPGFIVDIFEYFSQRCYVGFDTGSHTMIVNLCWNYE